MSSPDRPGDMLILARLDCWGKLPSSDRPAATYPRTSVRDRLHQHDRISAVAAPKRRQPSRIRRRVAAVETMGEGPKTMRTTISLRSLFLNHDTTPSSIRHACGCARGPGYSRLSGWAKTDGLVMACELGGRMDAGLAGMQRAAARQYRPKQPRGRMLSSRCCTTRVVVMLSWMACSSCYEQMGRDRGTSVRGLYNAMDSTENGQIYLTRRGSHALPHWAMPTAVGAAGEEWMAYGRVRESISLRLLNATKRNVRTDDKMWHCQRQAGGQPTSRLTH
ncbi:hypothetical protein BDZ97DRAFT_1761439 [Flammula alnicola]|nr:hypothetical protein BDZ97DRAFT_1761439 [Flammula alnicola]